MELRDYQLKTINRVRDAFKHHKKICLMLCTGGGKTIIAAEIIKRAVEKGKRVMFICDRIELIEQTSDKFDKMGISHGVIQADHWRWEPHQPVQVCSIQTLSRRRAPDADLIITDECFTEGTKIDTPKGALDITVVRTGDVVYNATGIGIVTATMSQEKEEILEIRLSNGKKIKCTGNHPFFTESGWKKAEQLEVGQRLASRKAVFSLWKDVQPHNFNKRWIASSYNVREGLEQANYLREILCEEVEKSNAQKENKGKGFKSSQEDRSQATNTRREWERANKSAVKIMEVFGRWLEDGIYTENSHKGMEGGEITQSLQDRYRKSIADDSNRSGWFQPLHYKKKGARQEEGFFSSEYRVESISVIKQKSIVYNLQVSGHPSFFADGVLVHNCHSIHKEQIRMMEKWDNLYFLGLTATPFTNGMGKHWDKLVVGARTQELIDMGYLVPFTVYGPPPVDLSKVKTQAGDYNQKQLGEAVDKPPIIGDIVKTWLSLGENRKTICFAVNIAHSKHIVAEFNHYGIPAAHIDAYTHPEERLEIHKQFKDGEIKILSSVDVLTKGYDAPEASCLIMARPTKSLTVYVQQFGRVLRIAEGKKNAIVLDHGGNVSRHGFPTDQLPEVLCNGEKKKSDSKKKERLPKPCPKCHFIKQPDEQKCPKCGFKPERLNEIDNTDDKLVKIEKIDTDEKLRWYAMLLYHAREKGYKDGWASHKYKEKFGVWPCRKTGIHPLPPNQDVKNWIKYLQIRNAKRKPDPTKCRWCMSTDIRRGPGKGPHAGSLICGGCGRHLKWLKKG